MATFDFGSLPTVVRDQVYFLFLPALRRLWVKKPIFSPSPKYAEGPLPFGSPQSFRRMQKYQLQAMALAHWDVLELSYGLKPKDDAQKFPALLSLRLVNRTISAEVDRILYGQLKLWLGFNDAVRAFVDSSLGIPSELPILTQIPEPEVEHLADMRNWRERRGPELTTEVWDKHVKKLQAYGLLRWISRFRYIHILVEERFVPRLGYLAGAIAGSREKHFLYLPSLHFTVCGFKDYFKTYLSDTELYQSYGDGKLPESLYALCRDNFHDQEGSSTTEEALPSSDNSTIPPTSDFTPPGSTFRNLKQTETTDLWFQRHPFDPTHQFLMEDFIFYKIEWSADVETCSAAEPNVDLNTGLDEHPIPDSFIADTQADRDRGINSPVKGSYINFARPGTMKTLIGWEPGPSR